MDGPASITEDILVFKNSEWLGINKPPIVEPKLCPPIRYGNFHTKLVIHPHSWCDV